MNWNTMGMLPGNLHRVLLAPATAAGDDPVQGGGDDNDDGEDTDDDDDDPDDDADDPDDDADDDDDGDDTDDGDDAADDDDADDGDDADDDDDTKGGTKKAEARIRKLVDEKNALKKRNAELEKLSGDDGKAILAAAERSGILPGLMTKAEAEAFEDIETLPRVIERYEDWLDDHGTDDEFELGGNKTMTYGEVKKRVRRLRSQLEDLKDKYGERRKALMEKVRKIYETGVAALEAGWTPGKKTAKKGERTKPKGKEDRPGGKSPSQLQKHAAKRPEDFEVDDEDDLDAFIAAENRREKKRRN